MTFAALLVIQKREKKKSHIMILSGRRGADPYKLKPKYSQQPKQKIYVQPAFSFVNAAAKEKAIKKKTPK